MARTMLYNPELMRTAMWACEQLEKTGRDKQAFVPPGGGAPPGGDPTGGAGAAGGDPSMAGGMPPGMPPGGAPPGGDPTGGAGAAGGSPDITSLIQTTVQQAVQQAMGGMGGGAAAGGAPGAAGGMKPAKPDLNTVAMDIFQVKKMLTHLFNMQGIPLPPDILDGPNRDPQLGSPMPPGTPGSTSDPNTAQQSPAGGDQQSSIQPIQAMQGAFPGGAGGGGEKSGSVQPIGSPDTSSDHSDVNKAANLASLIRRIQIRR